MRTGRRLAASTIACVAWWAPVVAASAPHDVHVAIVVERPDAQPVVRVVEVAAGSSGVQVLAKLSTAEGWGAPTFDSTWSGFLCGIDGHPSTSPTCLSSFNPHAPTWALWIGGPTGWHYAETGIESLTASEGQVEAWRLEPGTASYGTARPPSAPATFEALEAHQTPLEHDAAHTGGALPTITAALATAGLCAAAIWRRRRATR